MLQHHLQWNAARLAFVSTFLIALMRVKTVNLAEIATGFSGEAKVASHYKRIQRFSRDFEVDYESIALMIVKVMKIPEPWVISIDRTDWQFGKTVFNVLTLSTGQKFNGVEESLGIEMKVKDEVTQEIKATTKNAFR
jgi:hypothetical protein